MNILADADALVALSKKDDSNHRKALSIVKNITAAVVYISPFTVPEAATVLSHKVSQKEAVLFLKEMRRQTYILLPLDIETEQLTDSLFCKEKKKGTSWADCLNVVLVRMHDLDGIFSFDKFYGRYGVSYVS